MFFQRIYKLFQLLQSSLFIAALVKGAAAGTEHRSALQGLDLDQIVDIGANRGQFALISRQTFPKAFIYSFEPLEEPSQVFRKVFEKDERVKLKICAIGSEKKIGNIHISRDDDSSSLLKIGKKQTTLFPGSAEIATREVNILPLVDALSAITISTASLLKIDVQGYEMDAILGCRELLTQFNYIYIECSFIELYIGQALAHEVIAFLQKSGFNLMGIYNVFYDHHGLAIQADFMFINSRM
jgi:FkbM family methyltransferase